MQCKQETILMQDRTLRQHLPMLSETTYTLHTGISSKKTKNNSYLLSSLFKIAHSLNNVLVFFRILIHHFHTQLGLLLVKSKFALHFGSENSVPQSLVNNWF